MCNWLELTKQLTCTSIPLWFDLTNKLSYLFQSIYLAWPNQQTNMYWPTDLTDRPTYQSTYLVKKLKYKPTYLG